jgi:hypothetical protein
MQEIYGQGMNKFWTSLTVIFALGITWAWAQSSSVLHEDFTCVSGKWPDWNEDTLHVNCQNDQLHLLLDAGGYLYQPFSHDLADSIVEVDAVKLRGKDNTSMGLICRLKNNSFYAFLYYPETFDVGIFKYDRGEWETLAERTLSSNFKINPSDTANRFRAECLGEKLTLSINNRPVLTAYDDDFRSGDIGTFASGSSSKPVPVEIAFDNLEVFDAGQP